MVESPNCPYCKLRFPKDKRKWCKLVKKGIGSKYGVRVCIPRHYYVGQQYRLGSECNANGCRELALEYQEQRKRGVLPVDSPVWYGKRHFYAHQPVIIEQYEPAVQLYYRRYFRVTTGQVAWAASDWNRCKHALSSNGR